MGITPIKTDADYRAVLKEIEQMILNTFESSSHLPTPQVKELLSVLKGEMSRDDLQTALGLQDRKSFSERYLKPALNAGLIEMTIPEKPNSRLQKYRLTGISR